MRVVRYEGPLFIDFRLPAAWRIEDDRLGEPVTPEQVVAGDVGRMATEHIVEAMELSLAGGFKVIVPTTLPYMRIAWLVIVASEMLTATPGVGGFGRRQHKRRS